MGKCEIFQIYFTNEGKNTENHQIDPIQILSHAVFVDPIFHKYAESYRFTHKSNQEKYISN